MLTSKPLKDPVDEYSNDVYFKGKNKWDMITDKIFRKARCLKILQGNNNRVLN